MQAVYLIAIILGISGQNILKKSFAKKHTGQGVYTFSLLAYLCAIVFFLLTSRDLQWNWGLIPYAFFFALFFGSAAIFSTLALSSGPLSLTALISSFSLMIPTFYGLIFLKEGIRGGFIPGLLLLALSLVLINRKSKDSPLTIKWLIFSLISFLGNGMCSVVQKMQQIAFAGHHKNEFMILSLSIVCLILGIPLLIKERDRFLQYTATGWYLSAGCGIMNGAVNLFVMILSGMMSVSLMFPLMSVGGILLTFTVSKLFYKEHLTKAQYSGFLCGIGAIILLNL